jgi:carbon storage regulator
MLTIPRKKGESVVINDDVILTVLEIRGDKVWFEFQYPRDASVHRKEVCDAITAAEGLPSYGTGWSP